MATTNEFDGRYVVVEWPEPMSPACPWIVCRVRVARSGVWVDADSNGMRVLYNGTGRRPKTYATVAEAEAAARSAAIPAGGIVLTIDQYLGYYYETCTYRLGDAADAAMYPVYRVHGIAEYELRDGRESWRDLRSRIASLGGTFERIN